MEKIRAEELLRNLRDIHLTADRQVPKEQIISKQHLHTLTLGETVNEEELTEFLGTTIPRGHQDSGPTRPGKRPDKSVPRGSHHQTERWVTGGFKVIETAFILGVVLIPGLILYYLEQ